MSLHPPKRITSTQGLGVGTTKSMQWLSETKAIGTEVWNEMSEPWKEGETIIALPGYIWTTQWEVGKPYIITEFKDEAGKLIATYCDVTRPVRLVEGGFEFVDLYLDVWMVAGKKPVVLDEDELHEAVTAGYVTQEEAEKAEAIALKLIEIITVR
jgi:predicted RNA-binding protein associated with RNAse of E/G family